MNELTHESPSPQRSRRNLLLATDSYKVSHHRQYPPNTRRIHSFFESRGGRFDRVVFFGLQYYLQEYLAGPVVTHEDIDEAKELYGAHFGDSSIFLEEGWRKIVERHEGRLPVEIRAVPEGTSVPVSNVLMTVENTDPELPWVTNYLETMLSMIWYPCTVATQSREMRVLIDRALAETGCDKAQAVFKLHDFGFRGSTSQESAGIGGAAHLLSFQGTDTIAAIRMLRTHYAAPMAGFSIPAAEHSTITSWGRDNEAIAYRNMLEKFPTGLVAVVSDSYDIFRACSELWGKTLRDQVLAREGTLVVRPDSGDPVTVVLQVLSLLGEAFGTSDNEAGFRVLNPKVRVIQGDGIDFAMLGELLNALRDAGWAAENLTFGSGGGLLQKLDRDTQKFAFKCCAVEIEHEWRDVLKDPVTDPGKRSKAGRLKLVLEESSGTHRTVGLSDPRPDLLEPVFRHGNVLRPRTLEQIRATLLHSDPR